MAIETVGIAAYMLMSAGLARGAGSVPTASSSLPIYSVSHTIPDLDAVGRSPTAKGHYELQTRPSDLDRLIGRINSHMSVSNGWDGNDAVAPPSSAVSDAIEFLTRYASLPSNRVGLPRAMLSSDGTVGLYWHADDSYLDVEFSGDGTFSRFERKASGFALTEGLAITRDAVLSIIDLTSEWAGSTSSA